MKIDGFGVEHRSDCREPEWSSVRVDSSRAVQRRRRCGDPTTPARTRVGYTFKKGTKK